MQILRSQRMLASVKTEKKSDIDAILNVFDGYTHPSEPSEVILDTEMINDDIHTRQMAVSLFGEVLWNEIPKGWVMFHS